MKRIYTYLTLLALALIPATLTSCDDDPWYDDYYGDWYDDYNWYDDPFDHGSNQLVEMAQTLNGTWSGAIVNEYTNDQGQREQTRCSADFTFTQYTAKSNNGTGYETDYDTDGNEQTLRFKWYIDPRTGNIYIEYASGMRYLLDARGNTQTSGFSLGWDKKEKKDLFNGVMEGVNNDEYVFFDLERITGSRAIAGTASTATATLRSSTQYGSAQARQHIGDSLPVALHRR